MKHRYAILPLVIVLALIAMACVKAASPRGWASPTQYSDLVLVSTARGKLDAIHPATGIRQWRFPDDWDITDKAAQKLQGVYATPVIAGTRAYVADYNGYVYALDLATQPTRDVNGKVEAKGKVIWSRKPGKAISGGLALDADTGKLFVTNADFNVYAVNTSDDRGQFEFVLGTGDQIWSAPTISGGRVYITSTDGKLYALDARTAKDVWRPFQASAALVTTPTISGGLILAGSFDSHLYAVSSETGREVWSFEAANWVWSQPIVDSGTVYFGDFDGNVYALNLSDGKPRWQAPFKVKGPIRGAPALAGGTLVVATHDGLLYGIDPGTGAGRWESVDVGSPLNADLAKPSDPVAGGAGVYIAPEACSTQGQSTTKIYYYGLTVGGDAPKLVSSDTIC